MDSFDHSICNLMGFGLLQRQGEKEFRAVGQLPPWWSMIDEASAAGDTNFTVGDGFPFLDNFLIDAAELWEAGAPERLGSGIWQYRSHNGTELMLEAFAIHTGSLELLIIQNVTQGGTALEYLQEGRRTQLELLRDLGRRRQLELELRTGQEQSIRLDRAKTEFVANVSHEMRTPLTTILGMCELLAESSLNDEQRDQLKTLESSANSLLAVVSDLLDVARVEAGTITTRDEHFSPATLIRRVERDYGPAAAERGIRLKVQLTDDLPEEIYSDSNRLGQVLNNLVDNAIKFTERGTVTLSALRDDIDGRSVLSIQVADTGVGIELDQQAAIFTPYVQTDTTADKHEQGVGLGLAIANRLTEAIDGDLSVVSTPGKGSVFKLVLPIDQTTQVQKDISDAEPATNATEVNQSSDSLRILVAEDNPVNRKFITKSLTKSGHQVTSVNNGQEVLAAVEKQSFDVILMDCQMPIMSGYEAASAIRSRETKTGSYLPIIAVTAHAMEENRTKCLDVGMDFFVTKPFKTKDLLPLVQQAASRRKG